MPVIGGKVVRARYTSLKLNEISSVDRPAQPGCVAVAMKRHDRIGPVMKFEERVLAIAKRDSCTHTQAMSKARVEFPDEFEALQEADSESAPIQKLEAGQAAIAKAQRDFNATCYEIAKRDRLPLSSAMSRARMEAPEAFAAAYS